MNNGSAGKIKNKKKNKISKEKDKVEQEDFIIRISHDPDLLLVYWD